MNKFQIVQQHLNKNELAYLKMIMNPFENTPIRAPSNNPLKCALYTTNCNTWYSKQTMTNQYILFEFRPASMINIHNDTSLAPIRIVEYSNITTTSNFRYVNSDSTIDYTNLNSTTLTYRLIAAAVRITLDVGGGGRVGHMSSFNVKNDELDEPIYYIPENQSTYYVERPGLTPFATQAASTIYTSGLGQNNDTYIDMSTYNSVTGFYVPFDNTREDSQWSNNSSGTINSYPYNTTPLVSLVYRIGSTNADQVPYFQIQARAIFEVIRCKTSNMYGCPALYPNYNYNSMSRVCNLLQGDQIYHTTLDTYNFTNTDCLNITDIDINKDNKDDINDIN